MAAAPARAGCGHRAPLRDQVPGWALGRCRGPGGCVYQRAGGASRASSRTPRDWPSWGRRTRSFSCAASRRWACAWTGMWRTLSTLPRRLRETPRSRPCTTRAFRTTPATRSSAARRRGRRGDDLVRACTGPRLPGVLPLDTPGCAGREPRRRRVSRLPPGHDDPRGDSRGGAREGRHHRRPDIRLSVGIEDKDDILADVEDAITASRELREPCVTTMTLPRSSWGTRRCSSSTTWARPRACDILRQAGAAEPRGFT